MGMSSDTSDSTPQLLFNMISKYLDKNTVHLLQQQVTIDKQMAIISYLNLRKSKKIKIYCTNVFASIDSILAVQKKAEQRELAVQWRKFDQEAQITAKIILQKGMNNCIIVLTCSMANLSMWTWQSYTRKFVASRACCIA